MLQVIYPAAPAESPPADAHTSHQNGASRFQSRELHAKLMRHKRISQ